ncbi:hypothetical protein BCR33DRAFT_723059 [Rhizoclosmatium globosum]|uniref:RRM domain-containing protein n=1 Tax=Rhizoclosmatium globosum TaxID=329046 RepID=A0A1Y2BGA2_9FUNG|nr:hypothetical protein BCR33DRAFT_723059 [Rhizoclosmatium globosum]|eukprot:ORY33848.1 hypothetical protein BCR33DRAFT_723059 [Rhizoclosmatium globosum]
MNSQKHSATEEPQNAANTENATLDLKNLSPLATKQDLFDLFQTAGRVVRAFVASDNKGRLVRKGTVVMQTLVEAENAIARYNGFVWMDYHIDIKLRVNSGTSTSTLPFSSGSSSTIYSTTSSASSATSSSIELFEKNMNSVSVGTQTFDFEGVRTKFQETLDDYHIQDLMDELRTEKIRSKSLEEELEKSRIRIEETVDALRACEERFEKAENEVAVRAQEIVSRLNETARILSIKESHRIKHEFKSTTDKLQSCHLYVGGLPKSMNSQQLLTLLSKAGEVQNCLIPGSDQGRSLGFALVKIKGWDAGLLAIEIFNKFKVNGKEIDVHFDATGGVDY